MRSSKTFIGALGLCLAAGIHTFACDVCAIYTATEAQGESKTGWFAGVAEQFTRFGTLQFEGSEVTNPIGQRLDSSITQAILGYSFTERFSLQANLPFIYRSFKRPEGFRIDEGTESGLGDVSLLGKFLLLRKDTEAVTFIWNALGGVKFPTGDSSRIREELNEVVIVGAPESGIHGHDLTLGSGSFDGIAGTSFYLRLKHALVTGGLQYSIRTEGDFDYQFANDLSWDCGPGFTCSWSTPTRSPCKVLFRANTRRRTHFGADPQRTRALRRFMSDQG